MSYCWGEGRFYAGAKLGPILCSPHGPMAHGSSDLRRGAQTGSAVAAATLIQCRDVPIFTLRDVTYRPTI